MIKRIIKKDISTLNFETLHTVILCLLLLVSMNMEAQEKDQYFFFNAGAGLQPISYSLSNGNQKGNVGFIFNAGYNYFFSTYWGIETGLGIQSLQSVATLNYMISTPATDSDGDSYMFRMYYNNWKEKQSAYLLDIPLGIRFRMNTIRKWGWTASAGGKISSPFSSSYKSTGGEIITTGYYSQWKVELSDMPQHGFSTVTHRFSGKISSKTLYSLFADLGATYKLTPSFDLYAGAYINYKLNNMLKTTDHLVYQKDGVYNGVLNSNQVDKGRMISVGLKIGVFFHLGQKEMEDTETWIPQNLRKHVRKRKKLLYQQP